MSPIIMLTKLHTPYQFLIADTRCWSATSAWRTLATTPAPPQTCWGRPGRTSQCRVSQWSKMPATDKQIPINHACKKRKCSSSSLVLNFRKVFAAELSAPHSNNQIWFPSPLLHTSSINEERKIIIFHFFSRTVRFSEQISLPLLEKEISLLKRYLSPFPIWFSHRLAKK